MRPSISVTRRRAKATGRARQPGPNATYWRRKGSSRLRTGAHRPAPRGSPAARTISEPRPNTRVDLRTEIMRLVQLSSDDEAARLRLDVDRLVAVDRVHDHRQEQLGRVAAREPAVAVGGPLHRRAHTIAVAEIDVVAHADLVAIVEDRRAGQRQQQRIHQFDLAPVIVHQRREPTADAEIDARARVGRIGRPQIVTLGIGHHLQRQFVVVTQEQRPLTIAGDVRGLPQDIGDREAVFLRNRHVDTRHQRKVISHVAFITFAKIGADILRPLVRLGEQELAGGISIEFRPDLLDDSVRLGKVFVAGAVTLDQIGNRVEPESVDTHVEPAAHHLHHRP